MERQKEKRSAPDCNVSAFTPLEISSAHRDITRFLTGPVRNCISNGAGFTLIEVLISISIFVVTIITIYSLFINGLHTWKKSREYIKQNLPVQLAIKRMQNELKNSFKFSSVPFAGNENSVAFPFVNAGKIFRIEYSYQPDTKSLLRREQTLEKYLARETPKDKILCSNINSFSFSYSYKDESGLENYKWKDVWQFKEPKLPKAIKFDFILDRDSFTPLEKNPHPIRLDSSNRAGPNFLTGFTKIISLPQGEFGEDVE